MTIVICFEHLPSGANGIIVSVAGCHCDVPALHDPLMRGGWDLVIIPKPVPPDQISFERNWPLLVLCREHQAADFPLDPIHCKTE